MDSYRGSLFVLLATTLVLVCLVPLIRADKRDVCERFKSENCCPAQVSQRQQMRLVSDGIKCVREIVAQSIRGTGKFPEICCKLKMFEEACKQRPKPSAVPQRPEPSAVPQWRRHRVDPLDEEFGLEPPLRSLSDW